MSSSARGWPLSQGMNAGPSDNLPPIDPWAMLLHQASSSLMTMEGNMLARVPTSPSDEGMVRSAEGALVHNQPCEADLCEAVVMNDVQRVRDILCTGHNPNCRDEDGNTPLHIAADEGRTILVKMLVWAGADVEARAGDMNATPLLVAAANGQTGTALALLLELGADPNPAGATGTTALEIAARNNDVRLVLALLQHGAEVDARSSNGWTPLHAAVGFNHPVAISVLVRYGANANNRDNDGDTPLITACSLGYIDCVQQLLQGGADPRMTTPV